MRTLRFVTILLVAFATTVASAEEWAPGTTFKEKVAFAKSHAAARCGNKIVGGNQSALNWVSKQMVIDFIDGQCPDPAKKTTAR